MAFVNEYIREADLEKYHIKAIDKKAPMDLPRLRLRHEYQPHPQLVFACTPELLIAYQINLFRR